MSEMESKITLPDVPAELADKRVAAWAEPLVIDTYDVLDPEPYPAFLDRRVYQGSSGRVYPLPFAERVAATKAPRTWQALHLENEFVRLVVLPELGGRIHIGFDKTNGYDFFYRNNVIKPAMVALAGPWISGGVEFNWPQHHRPGTYLPVSWEIEYEDDGSANVWCSDHDPLQRMRSVHGVRLRPGSSLVELRVRLINRTETVQTFLWWANVAAKAGDDYQSFFPEDVTMVADHARRATTTFPRSDGDYYGINYPSRVTPEHPDGDRLDWYRNIPVPTSYMCIGSRFDFFGGYDHGVEAGFIHWADHHVAPGKKQWTWGNSPFGWAWDRNLTDGDGPYVELMAGVYTDNQPDFSFLTPGETKTFSQYWYPIRAIGPAQQATREAALSCVIEGDELRLGLVTTSPRTVTATLRVDGRATWTTTAETGPGHPVRLVAPWTPGADKRQAVLDIESDGVEILTYALATDAAPVDVRQAVEPTAPDLVGTIDELAFIAQHLAQYRHATRSPEAYWNEMLRRDPGESRALLGLAKRAYGRGQLAEALAQIDSMLARETAWNVNPANGEAHYLRGVVLVGLERPTEAYDALAKAAWNNEWRIAAGLAMARLDAAGGRPGEALRRADEVLALDASQGQARAHQVLALRRLGRLVQADEVLADARAADPLDAWLADLAGFALAVDAGVLLDVALEYASAGATEAALRSLEAAAARDASHPLPGLGSQRPLIHLHRADLLARRGDEAGAQAALVAATKAPSEGCFPGRLADALMLQRLRARYPEAPLPAALLGHWLYAHDRQIEAIAQWQVAVDDPVSLRNRGVGAYNVQHDPAEAVACYDRALALAPTSGRLWFERDQLAKRMGEPPAKRLARLATAGAMIRARDDLAVEYAALLLALGEAAEAAQFLNEHQFQPWEGGEGAVLRVWERTHLTLARRALAAGDATLARTHLDNAWHLPVHLGEDRHPLANTAELYVVDGDIRRLAGDEAGAETAYRTAAAQEGDFIGMAVAAASTRSYASLVALRRLGDEDAARRAATAIMAAATEQAEAPATIDYFATSLPNLLLFDEDLAARNRITGAVIRAQIAAAMGDREVAADGIAAVLSLDPNEPDAIDLATGL